MIIKSQTPPNGRPHIEATVYMFFLYKKPSLGPSTSKFILNKPRFNQTLEFFGIQQPLKFGPSRGCF